MISILTVTNRPRWMPWLLHQVQKQSFTEYEHVVVYAGDEPKIEATSHLYNVNLIRSPRASIPHQRNLALGAALGEIVCWFDDDDWQHPDRLQITAMNIGGPISYIANRTSYMLDAQNPHLCRPLGYEPFVFNGAGFANDDTRPLPWFNESLNVDEDIDWLRRLHPNDYQIVQRPILSAWLSHGANVTGRRDGQVFDERSGSRVRLSETEHVILRSVATPASGEPSRNSGGGFR